MSDLRERIETMSQHELATLAATLVFIYLGPRALEALASELVGRPVPRFPEVDEATRTTLSAVLKGHKF